MKKVLVVLLVICGITILAGCTGSSAPSESSASSEPSSAGGSASSASGSSTVSSAASPSSASGSVPTSSVAGILPESEWGDLFATLGEDAVAFGNRVQAELPVKAYACWQGEGGGDPLWYEDPADITALFNALAESGIAGEAKTVSTDDYTSFGFEFADGTRFGVMMDSMSIQVAEGNTWMFYEVDASPALQSFADQAKKHTMASYR